MKMSSKLGLFVCAVIGAAVVGCSGSDGAPGATGPAGSAGPAGSGGGGGEASVSGITPGRAFLARKLDVTVSGFGTAWSTTTTLDFGAGVTVDGITVASPTALVASITIDKTAAAGARDVTINDGSKKEVYKGAFKVDPPATIQLQGSVAQGSVLGGHVAGKDLSTPFDTTTTGDGLFTPISYTNIDVTGATGVTVNVSGVSLYSVDLTMLVDVTAPTTAQTLEISSGPPMAKTNDVFPMPKALTLAARTPTMLTSGTPATGNVAKPFDSTLYQFTPGTGLSIVDVAATATDANAAPAVALLPKSGKFADLISFSGASTLVTSSADPFYAIYWDNTGTTGAFSVTAKSTAGTGLAETEPNNTSATAQTAASLPFILQGATLSSATDQDWVQYTAVAADIGKKFHVQTIAGDRRTDTVVNVFTADGTTSLGGPSSDSAYHENFVSSAITAAGVHYIKFSASAQGYSATMKAYVGIIRLQ